MKRITAYAMGLALFALASCGTSPENTGSSTPIDSTNINGDAPATYGAADPANPDSSRAQGANDTGLRANTAGSQDSAQGRVK